MTSAERRPPEVAAELGISTSTLRRWSVQFSDFLSTVAGGPGGDQPSRRLHRRYTSADVALLRHLRDLLAQGLTYDEARPRLACGQAGGPQERDQPPSGQVSAAVLEETTRALARPVEDGGVDLAQLMANTLHSLSDSQDIILSGQQTARQLLGVLLQDNFNLKEENTRLRERMLETERKLYELKRELDQGRSDERERMRQMEAYLFDLQRRLDALAERREVRAAAPAPPAEPPPPPPRPRPESAESAPAAATRPQRPGLWQRLLGRGRDQAS